MAQPKQRRGAKQGKGGGSGASWLGALLGGGGENPEFKGAASEVAAGTLSSPGEGYDPRAATSPKGVLTPELQATYNAGPNKPLNWLGRATGQPDYYSQWQSFMGQSGLTAQVSQQMEDIRVQHEKELKAIDNANLTERQANQARLESSLRKQEKEHAVSVDVAGRLGQIPNQENIAAINTVASPLIPKLGASATEEAMKAQGSQNALQNAQAFSFSHPRLSPGESIIGSEQLGPGMSAMNLNPSEKEKELALAMGRPTPLSGLQLYNNGQPFAIRPKLSAVATPMESFGYPYNPAGGNPGAFTVPGPAVVPQAQPLQPSVAPSNPSAFMQGSIASGARGLMSGLQSLWNNQIGGAAQKAPEVTPAPMLQDDQAALLRAAQEEQQRRMWLTPRLSPMFGY